MDCHFLSELAVGEGAIDAGRDLDEPFALKHTPSLA